MPFSVTMKMKGSDCMSRKFRFHDLKKLLTQINSASLTEAQKEHLSDMKEHYRALLQMKDDGYDTLMDQNALMQEYRDFLKEIPDADSPAK
jgi:hypothetical protein